MFGRCSEIFLIAKLKFRLVPVFWSELFPFCAVFYRAITELGLLLAGPGWRGEPAGLLIVEQGRRAGVLRSHQSYNTCLLLAGQAVRQAGSRES